ncbi:hypothetical protein MG293_010249 [Ovis ammon polii]|uniref:Uncharacterized protein n=2 Tax=Ovis TaxID=9935 RepID=A0AAD4U8U1_OVIAM|nr:hypothetical protein MG293_010249 [Ovis ammon polii]
MSEENTGGREEAGNQKGTITETINPTPTATPHCIHWSPVRFCQLPKVFSSDSNIQQLLVIGTVPAPTVCSDVYGQALEALAKAGVSASGPLSLSSVSLCSLMIREKCLPLFASVEPTVEPWTMMLIVKSIFAMPFTVTGVLLISSSRFPKDIDVLVAP